MCPRMPVKVSLSCITEWIMRASYEDSILTAATVLSSIAEQMPAELSPQLAEATSILIDTTVWLRSIHCSLFPTADASGAGAAAGGGNINPDRYRGTRSAGVCGAQPAGLPGSSQAAPRDAAATTDAPPQVRRAALCCAALLMCVRLLRLRELYRVMPWHACLPTYLQ